MVQSLHVVQDSYVTGVSTFNGYSTFQSSAVFNNTASFYDVIVPSIGNASNNGIEWSNDPGGGSGDRAYIKYYVQSGENTRLEIACLNDVDDDIYLNTNEVNISNKLNVTGVTSISSNLYVGGYSEFVGVVTFRGGTINIGDSNTDNINVSGEFVSNLVPNTDGNYDLGIGTQRWRNSIFSGIVTANSFVPASGYIKARWNKFFLHLQWVWKRSIPRNNWCISN